MAISALALTAVVAGTGFVVVGGPTAIGATPLAGASFGIAAGATPTSATTTRTTVTDTAGDRVSIHAGSAMTATDADTTAQIALASGRRVAEQARGKVSTAALTTSLASLQHYQKLNPDTVMARVQTTQTEAQSVDVATETAEQKAAAAKAKADAALTARATAAARAKAQAAANTVAGAQASARSLAQSKYGWGSDQFSCLVSLWSKESGWNYKAYNPGGGATGIPQALPGSKMASVSADWATNATTQVTWGLGYISGSYGTPCAAWSHSQSVNWY